MAVANVKWFDSNVYMSNKLAKMPTGTTMDSLVAQMEKAGYSGPEGYFRHFLDWGHKEDVSPSAGFDANQYYTFKAAHDYYSGDVSKVTAADVNKISTAVSGAGMDAWTHYQKFGTAEMINASNSFDTAAYLQAKSAAMGGALTAEGVALAIQNAGMNAYEHYMQFKGGAGEVAFDQTFVVASSKQISTAFTLTVNPDTATANVFEAPRGWTPGGTDQVNTLNDDDNLTGSGTNPTLNFTYVDNSDVPGAAALVTPKLHGIETVNVDVVGTTAVKSLDLQDSTGVKAVNVSRVNANTTNYNTQNIAEALSSMSVNNSQAPNANVAFTFLDTALAATTNSADVKLNNANIAILQIEGVSVPPAAPTEGYETLNLSSVGSANSVVTLQAEDLQTLNITGSQNLTIGGFVNVAGSLTTINGAAATGNLDLNLNNNILNAVPDGASGGNIALSVTTGSGADTIRVTADTIGATDRIDLGQGVDTVRLQSGATNNFTPATTGTANVFGAENLSVVRTADTAAAASILTVDMARFDGDQVITLSNLGDAADGAANPATFTLNNMSVGDASAIRITHSSTSNNDVAANVIQADVVAGVSTVGVAIVEGVNSDARFNFTLNADSDLINGNTTNTVTNITLADNDSESNSVRMGEAARHTGSLTVTGGVAGTFLNLDPNAAIGYGQVTTGAVGNATEALLAASRDAAVDRVFVQGGVGTAVGFTSVSAADFAGNIEFRVATSDINAHLGSGNDTVIFADRAGDSAATSGLTIQDTVVGGAGTDTIVLDGTGVMTLGASEWTNLSGVDVLRLAGVAGGTYNVRVTNQLVDQTDAGDRIRIVNNDGDLTTSGELIANIDLRALSANNHVTFVGANADGALTTAQTVILNDVTANGSNILNGGSNNMLSNYVAGGLDATNLVPGATFATLAAANAQYALDVTAVLTGNNNVLQIFDSSEVTIGDLANTSNFSRIQFVNDLASVQTLNLTLNNAVVDSLVNANHTATADQRESLTITAQDNPLVAGAFATLNVQAGTLGSQFNLRVTGAGGADTIVAGAGDDNITGGAGADTITIGAGSNVVFYTGTTTAALTAEGGDTVTDFTAATGNFSFASLTATTSFVTGTASAGETLIAAAGGAVGNVNFISNATGLSAAAEATFVYNTATGALTFDADGTAGGAAAITIVTLTGLPAMTAADIVLA